MFRHPAFWIAAVIVCSVGAVFSFWYFPSAFPIVSVDIRMDREAALASAAELAERYGWGPDEYRQAASFGLQPQLQEFVELEGGGEEAYRELLTGGVFHPYRWVVRHFEERETNETTIRFTPRGEPYGFRQRLAEDAPGAALSEEEALPIAERGATADWGIDLAAYERVEASQETQPGGRIDHTFVYERSGVSYGDGKLRLRLVVGGDELTELAHYLEVPEAFSRRYAEMRSTNDLIGALAQIGALLGYLCGIAAVALFFLYRERRVLWKKPLVWGLFVAFLQVLVVLNQLPLMWMGYDTALSSTNFLLQNIGFALLNFVALAGIFTVSFMAAESMTRKAFPDQIQLWRIWSPGVANSPTVAGLTIVGYLLIGFFFAYEVILYLFAHEALGWWSPLGALSDPNVLANYFPWLTAIAVSLQAGFWEECLFRAVPIAGAALLGRRYGRPTAWIIGAFIIQALVFGAGHAPYPTQPAYARVVELIVPSIGFGLLYLYFGLLPAIVLHYVYDVVWIAMPLFSLTTPGAWIDRTIVVVLALVPLGVVFYRRARAASWLEVPAGEYNGAWEPPPAPEVVEAAPALDVGEMNPTVRRLLPVAGIVGLVLWVLFASFSTDGPAFEIDRAEAIRVARAELDARGIELSPEWRTLTLLRRVPSQQHRFVWQEGGPEPFRQLSGTYLGEPRWVVRFARFEGDVAERAEEYYVTVSTEGEAIRFAHWLPEARPGADLSEEEARQIAGGAVREGFGLAFGDPEEEGGLHEISAVTEKRPERRDWTFIFEDRDNYPLEEGSARIEVEIGGDEVTQLFGFVHVPEEWQRDDRNRQVVPNVAGIVVAVLVALVVVAGAVGGAMVWAKGRFSVKTFLVFLGAMFGLAVFQFVNDWPSLMSNLQTAMPIGAQIVVFIAGLLIGAVILSAATALLAGWLHRAQWDAGQQGPMLGESLWVGASLGLLVAGASTAFDALSPSLAPTWASYGNAQTFLPTLGTALAPLSGLISTTLVLLLVFTVVGSWTSGWTRRTGLFAVLLVLLGLLANPPLGLISWIVSGLLIGALILVGYLFVLRYDLTALPVAVGVSMILDEVQQAVYGAHPGAVAGRIAAIVLIAAVAVLWTKKLRREEPAAA